MSIDRPLGAILTGGTSSRMGRDKADVPIDGSTMLQRVNTAMSPVTSRVVLLGPDREGWDSWPDSVHTEGPLAGVSTALSRAVEERVLMVAVDHPFVSGETLSRLATIDSSLPVVPVDEHGVRQVTCAVYPTSIAVEAAEEAAVGGSIQTLLDRVSFRPVAPEEWTSWGENGRSWFSVDSPDALAEAVRRFGGT